jgi:hypothetical protein
MVEVKCRCYFCTMSLAHPEDRHPRYREITGLLTVPESLDPADVIPREACITCGHVRVKES